jgi:hypothetical protein
MLALAYAASRCQEEKAAIFGFICGSAEDSTLTLPSDLFGEAPYVGLDNTVQTRHDKPTKTLVGAIKSIHDRLQIFAKHYWLFQIEVQEALTFFKKQTPDKARC